MGCFDVNCVVSGNAIGHKEKAVAIFSARQFMKMDQYSPLPVTTTDGLLFFPLKGEYDDYGFLENISDEFNKNLISELLEKHFTRVINTGDCDIDNSIIDRYAGACSQEKGYLPYKTYAHEDVVINEEQDEITHNDTLVDLLFVGREVYDSLVLAGLEREDFIGGVTWEDTRYVSLKNLNFTKNDIADYVQYLKDNIDVSLFFGENSFSSENFNNLSRARRRLIFSGDVLSAKALFHEDFEEPKINSQSSDIVLKYHLLDKLMFTHRDYTGERENTFYVLHRVFDSPLVLKFIEYLENNDLHSACEFVERYIETALFHEGMRLMHRDVSGKASKYSYEQHDQICNVIGRSMIQLMAVDANINKLLSWFENNNIDPDTFFAPDSNLEQVKSTLVKTLEKLNTITRENYDKLYAD